MSTHSPWRGDSASALVACSRLPAGISSFHSQGDIGLLAAASRWRSQRPPGPGPTAPRPTRTRSQQRAWFFRTFCQSWNFLRTLSGFSHESFDEASVLCPHKWPATRSSISSRTSPRQDDLFIVHDDGYRIARDDVSRDGRTRPRRSPRRSAARGIGADDKVVIWSENRPEWVVAMWGMPSRARCLVVPVDFRASADLVRRVSRIVQAKADAGRRRGRRARGVPARSGR